jgi:large subunit ribosomal protein L4
MAQLKEKIFNEELNEPVVHEAVRWFLASRRQGTHCAKTRTEVSGGGKKPWKQKGTGRARAGSNRSPLWRKGGVIFPPKPRDYSYSLPKKVRALALRVVLSELNRSDRIKTVEAFSLPQPKTKEGVKLLKGLGVEGKVLLVMALAAPEFERGVRNLAGVNVSLAKDVNIMDLMRTEWLVIEKPAVAQLEARLS